jgi:uncharacterized membrane protein YuzA (DUF378 family)
MPHRSYIRTYLHILAIFFVVLGGINSGIIAVTRSNVLEKTVGKTITTIIYIIIGISAFSLIFYRDTYLPFLGKTIIPCSILQDQIPAGATRSMTVRVKPNSKVVFWASEPSDGHDKNARDAYGKYLNSGVATSDHNGYVQLKVREPQSYNVHLQKIYPHIHFRVCSKTGFMEKVKTVFLDNRRHIV